MNDGQKAATSLTEEVKGSIRISYALRRLPEDRIASVLPCPDSPQAGDIVLAELEKIGKNASLELPNGRRCNLHEGDRLAVVFGNRYATMQFEGYVRADGRGCDLLSMGGVCGLVASKHASVEIGRASCRESVYGRVVGVGGRITTRERVGESGRYVSDEECD